MSWFFDEQPMGERSHLRLLTKTPKLGRQKGDGVTGESGEAGEDEV